MTSYPPFPSEQLPPHLCCVQLTGMKLLPAEHRTTAQPSQSIHGQNHPGFIDTTPCESPWLCYNQILDTVHGSQEQKSAPASSPDLPAPGQRLRFAPAHPGKARAGCKESWCRMHSEPVLQRGEWDRTLEQHKPSQFYPQDPSSSNHLTPAFALRTTNSHFSFKSCFSITQAEEWFIASNLIFS